MAAPRYSAFDSRRITRERTLELYAELHAGRHWTKGGPGVESVLTLTPEAEAARDQIVAGNSRLAFAFCRRRHGAHMRDEGLWQDLLQEALFGLCQATERWSPESGNLATYATPWMRTRVDRHLIACGLKTITLGNGIMVGGNRIPAAVSASFDAPLTADGGDSGLTLGGAIADSAPGPGELLERSDDQSVLCGILDRIAAKGEPQARAMAIVRQSLGICGLPRPYTLTEIAASLGVSRERARQIRAKGAKYIAAETGASEAVVLDALSEIGPSRSQAGDELSPA